MLFLLLNEHWEIVKEYLGLYNSKISPKFGFADLIKFKSPIYFASIHIYLNTTLSMVNVANSANWMGNYIDMFNNKLLFLSNEEHIKFIWNFITKEGNSKINRENLLDCINQELKNDNLGDLIFEFLEYIEDHK